MNRINLAEMYDDYPRMLLDHSGWPVSRDAAGYHIETIRAAYKQAGLEPGDAQGMCPGLPNGHPDGSFQVSLVEISIAEPKPFVATLAHCLVRDTGNEHTVETDLVVTSERGMNALRDIRDRSGLLVEAFDFQVEHPFISDEAEYGFGKATCYRFGGLIEKCVELQLFESVPIVRAFPLRFDFMNQITDSLQ